MGLGATGRHQSRDHPHPPDLPTETLHANKVVICEDEKEEEAAPALASSSAAAAAETSSHGIRQCTARLLLHQLYATGTDRPTNQPTKAQTNSINVKLEITIVAVAPTHHHHQRGINNDHERKPWREVAGNRKANRQYQSISPCLVKKRETPKRSLLETATGDEG